MNDEKEIIDNRFQKEKRATIILGISTLVIFIAGLVMLPTLSSIPYGVTLMVISLFTFIVTMVLLGLFIDKKMRLKNIDNNMIGEDILHSKELNKNTFRKERIAILILSLMGLILVTLGICFDWFEVVWPGVGFFLLVIPGGFILLLSLIPIVILLVRWKKLKEEATELELIQFRERQIFVLKRILLISMISITIITSSVLIGIYIPRSFRNSIKYQSGEIVILKNRDFKRKYNFPGSGTSEDPYIIGNLSLDSEKEYGIYIEDVTVHFTIENCSIHDCSETAIILFNVENSTAKIRNNRITIRLWGVGISIYESPNVVTENNSIITNSETPLTYTRGIEIVRSQCVKIVNNTITKIGKAIYYSDFYYYIEEDKLAYVKGDTIIANNTLINNEYGVYIDSTENKPDRFEITNNNICNNTLVGIENFDSGQLITIAQNELNYNRYGIVILNRFNGLIKNNSIRSNYMGITLVSYALFGDIKYNDFITNRNYSISIEDAYSNDVAIYQNNFISNNNEGVLLGESQAFDSSNKIKWFDYYWLIGNYWSDLDWMPTAIYQIDGSNNTDPYPLENPVN